MKQTKKALDKVFGDSKAGLEYLGLVKKGLKSPILIIYGASAPAFAKWAVKFASPSIETASGAIPDPLPAGTRFITIAEKGELSEATIQKSIKIMKTKVAVILLCDKKPTTLDYVYDPSFKLLNIEQFDGATIEAEIQEVLAVV